MKLRATSSNVSSCKPNTNILSTRHNDGIAVIGG